MLYYKLLIRRKDGRLISAGDMPYHMRQTYNPNKWVLPKIAGSKIFVFDDLRSARYFHNKRVDRHGRYKYELWSVFAYDATPYTHLPRIWDDEIHHKEKQSIALRFWKEHEIYKFSYLAMGRTFQQVYGTSAIKLIEKIS